MKAGGEIGPAGFMAGFTLPLRAARLVWQPGLKRYVMLPLAVNLLLYAGVLVLLVMLLARLDLQVTWDRWGELGAWLADLVNALLGGLKWLVGVPAILVLCYMTFTTVGMVIASPFNDLLSEKVEQQLQRAKTEPASVWESARGVLASTWDSVRIAIWQVLAMLLGLAVLWVPFAGPAVWLSIAAWYSGRGFVDVAMARHDLRAQDKRPLLRAYRWQIFGLGMAMELLFLIPFVGLLLLPVGVAAGTLLFTRWARSEASGS